MRLAFLTLLLANVVAFAFIWYAQGRPGPETKFALLQIASDKMKLLKGEDRGAMRGESADGPHAGACLEWGTFAAEDGARAQAALTAFKLGDKLVQREGGEIYWVHIPPLKTKAEADRRAAEVKAIGVNELYVMPENSQWRYAISLGMFRSQEAANGYLAQLQQKELRGAIVVARGGGNIRFVIRDPGDVVAAGLAALQPEFPGAQLKPVVCTDAGAAKAQ